MYGAATAVNAIPRTDSAAIVIASHSTRGEVSREYGTKDMTKRFGWRTLASAVAKLGHPGLDLSRLRPTKRRRLHSIRML